MSTTGGLRSRLPKPHPRAVLSARALGILRRLLPRGTPACPPHCFPRPQHLGPRDRQGPAENPSQGHGSSQPQTGRQSHGVPLLALRLVLRELVGEFMEACSCGLREQGSSLSLRRSPGNAQGGGLPHDCWLQRSHGSGGMATRSAWPVPWRPPLHNALLEGRATFRSNPGSATKPTAWPWQAPSFL